jgi:O-antigen/teichoic acid export membrane protein
LRVGGYIVGALVSVLSAALLFRHLGVRDTGRYVTALSLVAIVGSLSDLGLTAVGVRELSRRPPGERWALAKDLLGLRIILTVAGSAAVIGIAWAAYSVTLADGVALACVGLLLQATQDNFALPLVVDLRLAWVSALDLARQLLTTMLTVALVLLGATLVPFLGISIPVGAVVLVATVRLVRGTRSLAPTFSVRRWRKFMRAMLPYSAATAASALYFRVSILLVSALSTGAQLGYFSASFRIIEVLTLVPALLASSAFPIFARAARDDHERLGYALSRVFDVSVIVGAWVAVSTAVGAPLAIAIIGGPKFQPAVSVLAIQGDVREPGVGLWFAQPWPVSGDPEAERLGARSKCAPRGSTRAPRRCARGRGRDRGGRDRRGRGSVSGGREESPPVAPLPAGAALRRRRGRLGSDPAGAHGDTDDRASVHLHNALRDLSAGHKGLSG